MAITATIEMPDGYPLQRSGSSYLVDVPFEWYASYTGMEEVYDTVTLIVNYRSSPSLDWVVATAQIYDRKHTPNPLAIGEDPNFESGHFVWNPFFDLGEGLFEHVQLRLYCGEIGGHSPNNLETEEFVVDTRKLVDTQDDIFARSQRRRGAAASQPLSFLGKGIAMPMNRGGSDFDSASGHDLVRQCVRQCLWTRCVHGKFYFGELPWRPEFGARLDALRHRNNDPTLAGQAQIFVRECLRWEPRINVVDVVIDNTTDPSIMAIAVSYQIIDSNVSGNQVALPVYHEVVVL